jgi:hypothetical protein
MKTTKVLRCGHYHCPECRRHCPEQAIDPPDGLQHAFVFWCENDKCPRFGKAFVEEAELVEREEVKIEIVQ